MSVDIPTTEPRFLTAGDTWTWQLSLSDYPAGAGWVLTYALVSVTALITVTASASGDDHLVSVARATTAGYGAGDYQWQSYVTLGTARYNVGRGTLTVRANLATATTGYDGRSAAAKALSAIETYLTTGDLSAAEFSVDGRAVKYHSVLDLHSLRDKLKAEVANEAAAAKAAELGLDPRRYSIRLGVD